ncbi:chromatin assembly factor 1 subunit FAS1-like [Cornus florida]|uniref:chromatin assembly factor 1 subunit FAS1-like n=1 Tax=Cornus florida TaxID=4283 RepID=UPI0028981ACD|nr:chromatin assembly factor 1 subunit FAS1-like [Cornus florida]
MVDVVVIDPEESEKTEMNSSDQSNSAKKSLKRKRASLIESLSTEERLARIEALREELDGLFKYYRVVLDEKVNLDLNNCNSNNSRIACLLEESNLPLSKLVVEVYHKLKAKDGENGLSITLASVKSSVLLIGQRWFYGVPSADADVLEDETESCLWCWETRDVKLMPKSVRGALRIRRTCRKKIHERITAVSAMINALQNSESPQSNGHEQVKASERLVKVLNEADIRLLVESMAQKNGSDRADKEAKKEEKLIIKQLERNKREVEKEKKRVEWELQKEKRQSEKELKRLQDEAEKEERRRQKEESEMKRQIKRQQEEAEKDQRRREKEEAELKKQLAFQKQASLMERFLKRSKNNLACQNNQSSTKEMTSETSPNMSKTMPESVTHLMDCALSLKNGINTDNIRKSHLISWCRLGHSIRSNRKQHWGMRQKPKTKLIKEIKLTVSRGLSRDDELSIEKLVDGWDEMSVDGESNHKNGDNSLCSGQKRSRSKQLLQFDKSHRPAFYGIWSRKSQVVGPRHPFVKDPDLDYDVDSDEEWEEDEPGESLSDCDKDDEEAILEEGYSKAQDEDESEDGFFVPDGYLSENEGVNDRMDSDHLVEEAKTSPSCKLEVEGEEFCLFIRHQKCLHNLTESALRKNQPLIISNLMLEKAPLLVAEDLTGTLKLEQMCFQALRMRALTGFPLIEISIDNNVLEESQEASPSHTKGCTTPAATVTAILESDLPQIVSVIRSCSHGINKVVESLQQKFPTTPKSHLRSKVREISDFVDNRWQVKKNILDKLGLSISPVSEKGGGRTKSIATFFSKRCLPPAGKVFNPNETSPQSSQKPATTVQQQQYTYNHQ